MAGDSTLPTGFDLVSLAREGTVHFVGIAGAGMAALAGWLRNVGGRVDGCDASPGEAAVGLRAQGIAVERGHDPAHVAACRAVVVTAAMDPSHAELAAARARGIPVIKRAAALASVVNRGDLIAVAGTHGKTTTTAMATSILVQADLDPTAFVGGTVAGWSGGLRAGADRLFVAEADEYDRSFLTLRPRVAVVTSIEADHLDVYGTYAGVVAAFEEFVGLLPDDGLLVACRDDAGVRALLSTTGVRTLTYGTEPGADLQAVDVRDAAGITHFRVLAAGREAAEFTLSVPGLHNVRNALGAYAAARRMGADTDSAVRALAEFRGVGRRFEAVGVADGTDIIDDYAHHPTEIAATLAAARSRYAGRRLVAAFQPHLYSRTRDFAAEFGAAFAAADAVWICDVYPAREAPIAGISGEIVAVAARAAGAREVHWVPSLEDMAEALIEDLRYGDVLVTMGAGNIDTAARTIVRRLRERETR
jgi:UDP-N-acetylmuramate--alanine ligase